MTSGSDTIRRRWDASSTTETSAARGGQTAMHRFWTNPSCAVARYITRRSEHDKGASPSRITMRHQISAIRETKTGNHDESDC